MKFIRKKFFSFSIILIINIIFSSQNYITKTINLSKKNSELEYLYIKSEDECKKWIPSLLSPFLLGNIKDIDYFEEENIKIENSPLFQFETKQVDIGYYLFLGLYNVTIGINYINLFDYCYFGISNRLGGFENFKEKYKILNQMKMSESIDEIIFSFGIWNLKNETIDLNFYLGNSHENFSTKKKDGIFASCKTEKTDPFRGCIFQEMSFNGKSTELKQKDSEEYYKIYFSSENYDIIFPKSFENKFNNITNYQCNYTKSHYSENDDYLYCNNFFNKTKDYTLLKLINNDMEITIEIDNKNRFTNIEDDEYNQTRIRYYDNIEYFIFPLIMFKNFHVQFDDKNDLISFYTNDRTILKIRNEEQNTEGSSKGWKVFLIIIIIICALALAYGIFWLLKKRRSSVEKNINKYNKFDEDENFQDMNEKRVF